MMAKERVQKILSNYGFCSRRKAEKLISEGRVKINGRTVSIGESATLDDKIFVDDKIVRAQKKIYLIFHKPIKTVTALKDKEFKTIMDYIDIKERVYPVGRLDYLTSGLMILTNDGDFANIITHPSNEIKKTYLVTVDKPFLEKDITLLEKGIRLEDGVTSPAKAKKISSNQIELTIHEGKNRIVRRMIKKLGYRMKTLERIRIGKVELGNLKAGKYKIVTKKYLEDNL